MWLNQLVKQNDDFKNLRRNEKYVFSSGIWINPELGIPIRFLSYLLPVLEAKSEFNNSIWQIYFADKMAIKIWIETKIVEKNLWLYKELALGFIEEFYPENKWKIIFNEEKIFSEKELIKQEELVKEMIFILIESNDSQINNFAQKRWKKAFEYMAKHSLYMRDNVVKDKKLFLIDNPKWFEKSDVVMIWWPAEKIFYKARKILENNLWKPNWNLQLFTDIWRLPPYYSKFMENLFWTEIKENNVEDFLKNLNKEFQYDYLMLLIACSSAKNYSLIKKRKKWFNSEDFDILEEWFQNLKIFLKQF